MKYRHEVKCEIAESDFYILRQRLKAVMKPDAHTDNGVYKIRSLYFDNLDDKALREKLDGVNIREKYRIRLYNRDTSVIHLERKYKHGSLGYKDSAALTPEQAQAIVRGDIDWMSVSGARYSTIPARWRPPTALSSTAAPADFTSAATTAAFRQRSTSRRRTWRTVLWI